MGWRVMVKLVQLWSEHCSLERYLWAQIIYLPAWVHNQTGATFRYPHRVHRVWDLERGSCVSSLGESCRVLNVEPSHSCRIWGRLFIPIYNQRWTLATHFYQTFHIDYKLSMVMVDRCLSDRCLFKVIIRKQEIRSRVSNSRNDCDAKLFWFTRRYSAHIFNIDVTNTVTAFLQQEFFYPESASTRSDTQKRQFNPIC